MKTIPRAKTTANLKDWKAQKLPKAKILKQLAAFRKKGVEIVNAYEEALEELFLLRNPKFRFQTDYAGEFEKFVRAHERGQSLDLAGNWFYFPWLKQVVHYLPENMHFEMRTGRNKNLITKTEQEKYYYSKIGLMGMSVGSHVALTIAMTGGAREIRLADPDVISGPNLNRMRTGFPNVGLKKIYYVARTIMEINPYSNIQVYDSGITDANIEKFLAGLDLVVEEMDSPYFKFKTREIARKLGIPVIMAADNGDGIIADVERFDLKKNLPLLHGILGKTTSKDIANVPPNELPRTIAKIAGANIAATRMLESVTEVGRTLYSWPQLGTAASLCGSALAYLARKILVGDPIDSGRYEVNLDLIFERGFNSASAVKTRNKKRAEVLKKIGLK